MPDRLHRGAAPGDRDLFAPAHLPALRAACADMGWLLGRGYSEKAVLKLVGDHAQLNQRQRVAVRRSSAAPDAAAARRAKRVARLDGQPAAIDGFNLLIHLEAALSGGVILRGADGALRDLASVHGTYRSVSETPRAIDLAGEALARLGAGRVVWMLDSPVSNSGRLRGVLLAAAAARGWDWAVELHHNADPHLAAFDGPVATNDAWILDHCADWLDLGGTIVREAAPEAWLLDLAPDHSG